MIKWLYSHKLLVVIGICVAVRLAALVVFDNIFAFDRTGAIHGSAAYDTYAQNLLATGVYGITPGAPDALIPPLYSYILAFVYGVFGRGYLQVGLFHTFLDVLSITMLYAITRRLFARTAGETRAEWIGALAGLFYAVYPYLVFQNLTLIDTPLFMTLLHAFVLLMILLRERGGLDRVTWATAGAGGVILGLSMLVRPIMPPLALLVALWFLFRLNLMQTITRLLPVAVLGMLTLVPWIARNYAEFDRFVPMTTTSGANFWVGNNSLVIPYLRAGYDVQWLPLPDDPVLQQMKDPNSPEADARRFALGLEYLRENPDELLELIWVKALVYWSIDVTPRYNPSAGEGPRLDGTQEVVIEVDNQGKLNIGGLPLGDPVPEYSTPLFDQIGRTVHRLYFGGLLVLGLVGIVLTGRSWRDVSLLWFVQISMTLVYIIFHPSTRYRVPTDPMLFIFSAYTLVWLWMRYFPRQHRTPVSDEVEPTFPAA